MVKTLIERGFLKKLERLTLYWQDSFPGVIGGHNPSRYAGAGQEFLDHRHFHHGDDLRGVNWRAYMRFEKLLMKMFHIEPRIPVRLLLDVSRSMSTNDGAKFDYARRLAAALCYVGLVRLDTIAILPFHHSLGDPFLCSGGRHRFAPVVDFLTGLRSEGATDYSGVVRHFTNRFHERGLVIVISDFLDDENASKPLQLLGDLGQELFLIQVWDEEDRTPPWDGHLELVDAETGAARDLDFDEDARTSYIAAFDDYCRELQRAAAGTAGRYVGLCTMTSLDEAIFGPLRHVRGVR